jgi:hypothetical protein
VRPAGAGGISLLFGSRAAGESARDSDGVPPASPFFYLEIAQKMCVEAISIDDAAGTGARFPGWSPGFEEGTEFASSTDIPINTLMNSPTEELKGTARRQGTWQA